MYRRSSFQKTLSWPFISSLPTHLLFFCNLAHFLFFSQPAHPLFFCQTPNLLFFNQPALYSQPAPAQAHISQLHPTLAIPSPLFPYPARLLHLQPAPAQARLSQLQPAFYIFSPPSQPPSYTKKKKNSCIFFIIFFWFLKKEKNLLVNFLFLFLKERLRENNEFG